MAALLGADEFAFGTSVLIALGCDMARQCHLNTCPTGIATQRPELRAKFRGKPEHVMRFFDELASEIRQLLATLGLSSLAQAVGRTDLLEQVRWDARLDLKTLLAASAIGAKTGGALRWQGGRNDRPEAREPIDNSWVTPALEAFKSGTPFRLETHISNQDRTLGARLAGQLALYKTQNPATTGSKLTFAMNGVAGQSFGAFAVSGMTLQLEGLANDFVGKGLCGGELVLRGQGRAARESERHALLGNVALYGATGGWLFAAGRAGERFAVRNSGALAVVEGVGDHGCEYMTGGLAVVLGATGINFGAGMTGGLAWIYDEDGSFVGENRYHKGFLQPELLGDLDHAARQSIRELVELHATKTASIRADWLLANWESESRKFVRMTPCVQA
jgi:glutamate synthase domain-containing protein 3